MNAPGPSTPRSGKPTQRSTARSAPATAPPKPAVLIKSAEEYLRRTPAAPIGKGTWAGFGALAIIMVGVFGWSITRRADDRPPANAGVALNAPQAGTANQPAANGSSNPAAMPEPSKPPTQIPPSASAPTATTPPTPPPSAATTSPPASSSPPSEPKKEPPPPPAQQVAKATEPAKPSPPPTKANQPSKAALLRVGKGGTASSLADALNRIGKGGAIEVLPGIYTEELELGPAHEGVTIQATEPGKAIIKFPEKPTGNTLVRISQARGVRLKSLSFDGSGTAARGVHVVGKLDGDAAGWKPAEDVQIVGNKFYDMAGEAVVLDGPTRNVEVKENLIWNVRTGIFQNLALASADLNKLAHELTDDVYVVNNSMSVRELGVRFAGAPVGEKGRGKRKIFYQNNLIVGATRGAFVIEPYTKDLGMSEDYRLAYHVLGNSIWPATKTRADVLPAVGNVTEEPGLGSLDPAHEALFLRYDESSPIAKRAVKGDKVEEYAQPFIGAFRPYSVEKARELVKNRKPGG